MELSLALARRQPGGWLWMIARGTRYGGACGMGSPVRGVDKLSDTAPRIPVSLVSRTVSCVY